MRRVVAHVFVDDLARPALEERDVHHLSRVLRLRPGEAVTASDGRGSTRPCHWTGSPLLSPVGEVVLEPAPVPALTVAFALTKGEHPEWAVQKLTEAGVDRVIVMTTERCIVRWAPAAAPRQLERLREVTRQAAMQSRRAWLPAVDGPLAFADIVSGAGALDVAGDAGRAAGDGGRAAGDGGRAAGLAGDAGGAAGRAGGLATLALAVPGGAALTLATPTLLIGPEGGWSAIELAAAPAHVGLGPHILRAETAALAAGVLLSALRAGLAAPAPRSVRTAART